MFDVFYSGLKPNLFTHERAASTVEHAQKLSRTRYFWWITYLADLSDWDFLWEPQPWQRDFVHIWHSEVEGYAAIMLVPCNVENPQPHYHNIVIKSQPRPENYRTLVPCEFDYSWLPNPFDPPFIYVFGNQHWGAEIQPTVEYHVPGATEKKYMEWPQAQLLPDRTNWQVLEAIDEEAWDWSWRPDPGDPAYIYVFGNQWNPPEFKPSVEYHVPGATERKYMDRRTIRLPQPSLFDTKLSVREFDYSWEPNPFDPPYIYVFGNQWYSAEVEPTVEYSVPGAVERKYVSDIIATVDADQTNFHSNYRLEKFDYTWHPEPGEPPYIYVFGNQWYPAEIMPTIEYRVPGATELKYMEHPRAQLAERHDNCWHTLQDCEWDYSWIPDPGDPPYIYVFGNQWWSAEKWPTVKYTVPGATELKYMDYPRATLIVNKEHWNSLTDRKFEFDYSWQPDPGDPPYRYVFGNQWHSAEVMPTVEWTHPDATADTPTKYVDWPRAELLPDATHWTLPAGVTPDSVDFSWVPDPGEPPYIYQFATQHQKTGGPVYTVPGATEIKYLESIEIKIEVETVPIVEIDHLDGNVGKIANVIKTVRYFDNYRDTLIRVAKNLLGKHEFVWICSSICDYTDFDFTWYPEKWQGTMLHVFASDEQKFGDTFYMHVPTFAERAEKKALLEWYSVNYVPRKRVPRRPMPVFYHSNDTHVDEVKRTNFTAPLALFTVEEHVDRALATVPLWRQEVKTITPISKGASSVIVPKSAVADIKTQLYDYPHIDKTKSMLSSQPLDVVFISNGEPNAERNWTSLQEALYMKPNNLLRSDGVNGRVAAYHAAAKLSTTPWFFAVFAKLRVNKDFDWSWQPDRMQEPKHYIFHAFNPINGLTYGHQAMIAYNKKLVLANTGKGLDFTLDSAHEVVPVVSGTAEYADSPWMAWRTAFRECIKLRGSDDVESRYRLDKWLTVAMGQPYGQYSIYGAEDAVEYYDAVNGDSVELRKSYDWQWLASYALLKRNLVADQ